MSRICATAHAELTKRPFQLLEFPLFAYDVSGCHHPMGTVTHSSGYAAGQRRQAIQDQIRRSLDAVKGATSRRSACSELH
jgi:hypothetical protein